MSNTMCIDNDTKLILSSCATSTRMIAKSYATTLQLA